MACVLVSYNGRNKLVKIPGQFEGKDIDYLDKQCRKLFSFSSNVHINLTFQKYDPIWETDLDLDEDYTATNKDKLKLVVTPLLQTPTVSESTISHTVSHSQIQHLNITIAHYVRRIILIVVG